MPSKRIRQRNATAAASWSRNFWMAVRPRFCLCFTFSKSSKKPMPPKISAKKKM